MHQRRRASRRERSFAATLTPFLILAVLFALTVLVDPAAAEEEPGAEQAAPHFVLSDSRGRTVTDEDFRGRHLLVFFGYTHCPDICPTGLQTMSQVMDLLGASSQSIQPLFVTLDPERDTKAVLAEYVANFHPALLGLTGAPEMIASIAKGYRVKHERVPMDDGSYSIDHTGAIFHVGPDGALLGRYPPGSSAQDIAAQLAPSLATQ